MGKVGLDLPEIISERREGAMVGILEEDVELCAVELEAIHLAVFEFERADDVRWWIESTGGSSKTRICAEGSVGLEPVLECARGDFNVCFAPHDALGVR